MAKTPKRQLPQSLKESVKQRDNFRCSVENCPSHNEEEPVLNIHHVLPEKYGGSDEPSNLITLCVAHHKEMHIEFHAYYPDSTATISRMWLHIKQLTSKIESKLRFGEYYDYKAPLEYLTGHRTFRGGQDDVYKYVMQGRDVLFVAPTGIGKSITYQLPGLLRKNPTLVVSPLKSLMNDQVRNLWHKYIPATYVNGDLGKTETQNRIKLISDKMMKFVYVAPERYFKSPKSKAIFESKYDLFVIDEAHCIDKWGGHFRQDYGGLGLMRIGLGCPQTIAVTASASTKTQQEIVRSLGLKNPVVIVKGFFRPNIAIRILKGEKSKYLKSVLDGYSNHNGKTIIYVATVKEGNQIKEIINSYGKTIEFYHGQLDIETKNIIQNRFNGIRSNDEINMIIATSAFGMGIDIPNIRTVIHWNIPGNIEDYYQQIGRAGRDGKISNAILLYQPGDEGLQKYINERGVESNNNLSTDEKRAMNIRLGYELSKILGILNAPSPWGYMLEYFGDQEIVSGVMSWWQRIINFIIKFMSKLNI